jgi:hypothetical protein
MLILKVMLVRLVLGLAGAAQLEGHCLAYFGRRLVLRPRLLSTPLAAVPGSNRRARSARRTVHGDRTLRKDNVKH